MVRNLMMIAGLTLAVSAFGCSDDTNNGGGAGGDGGAGGGGLPVDQCDAADLAAIDGGEPDMALISACAVTGIGSTGDACIATINTCLQDGSGDIAGTTLSPECSGCYAEVSCCTLNECSVGATPVGPCVSEPPTAECLACIADKCGARQEACIGGGAGGAGGSGGSGGAGGAGGAG